ncbi:hypothetical protein ZWY2020_021000, partial [Hordeum vulgare]
HSTEAFHSEELEASAPQKIRSHSREANERAFDWHHKDMNLKFFYSNVGSRVKPAKDPDRLQAFPHTYRHIEDPNTHYQLHEDLIKHH